MREGTLFCALIGVFLLYPAAWGWGWSWGWGVGAGIVSGCLWARRPRLVHVGLLAASVAGGLLFSYALHANLWIPGLKSLLWLGS